MRSAFSVALLDLFLVRLDFALAGLEGLTFALFLGAAIMFWRFANRESDFLGTEPPTEPEPPPMLSWRYVRRGDRPAFFRTVAVVLGLCAAGLVYFAMQIQAVLKH